MNVMMDFLRLVPYLLVAAAMLFLLVGGLVYTVRFFRGKKSSRSSV